MLFKDVQVGQKFKLNDEILEKTPEVSQTCCRAASNASLGGSMRFIEPEVEVELINE